MAETVWLAYYGYRYEGTTVLGVFETEKEAEARLGRLPSHYGGYRDTEAVAVGEDVEVNV